MKLLLDPHVWLWSIGEPERLRERCRGLIADPANELLLSAASAWEIAIKYSLGKLALPDSPELFVPRELAAQRVDSLPVTILHALRVAQLPPHHRDPFDRRLVAQAQLEGASVITADPVLERYDVQLIRALP